MQFEMSKLYLIYTDTDRLTITPNTKFTTFRRMRCTMVIPNRSLATHFFLVRSGTKRKENGKNMLPYHIVDSSKRNRFNRYRK